MPTAPLPLEMKTPMVCGPSVSAVGTVHGLAQSSNGWVSTRHCWTSAPPTRVKATVGRGPDGLDGYDVKVTAGLRVSMLNAQVAVPTWPAWSTAVAVRV